MPILAPVERPPDPPSSACGCGEPVGKPVVPPVVFAAPVVADTGKSQPLTGMPYATDAVWTVDVDVDQPDEVDDDADDVTKVANWITCLGVILETHSPVSPAIWTSTNEYPLLEPVSIGRRRGRERAQNAGKVLLAWGRDNSPWAAGHKGAGSVVDARVHGRVGLRADDGAETELGRLRVDIGEEVVFIPPGGHLRRVTAQAGLDEGAVARIPASQHRGDDLPEGTLAAGDRDPRRAHRQPARRDAGIDLRRVRGDGRRHRLERWWTPFLQRSLATPPFRLGFRSARSDCGSR